MSNRPIVTSIHGRRFGLDQGNAPIFAYQNAGARVRGTSDTTATALANNGYVSVVTTTDDTWRLTDPFPGARVTIYTGSSSTGNHVINLNNSVAYTTNGIASSTATLVGAGASITLFGHSTGVWIVESISRTSDTARISS